MQLPIYERIFFNLLLCSVSFYVYVSGLWFPSSTKTESVALLYLLYHISSLE